MTYTYDPTTNVGRIRRTLPDRVEADAIWTDEEIESFLSDEGGNWRRATALALETMASDDLLILKTIQIHNIQTDSSKHAKVLMDRAKILRNVADEADANTGDDFEFIEQIVTDHQYRERIYSQALRGNI